MIRLRRTAAALTASLVLVAGQALAQSRPTLVPSTPPPAPASAPADDPDRLAYLREAPDDSPAARMGMVELPGNTQIGLGRFTVAEIARPRTNVEPVRAPTDLRMETDRVAGLGVRISF